MTTQTPTIDQVLDLAHKLPRLQRAELISRLAVELATNAPPARTPMTPDEARAALDEIREHFRAQGPVSPSMSEQLDLDRRARDALLRGEA
jgi:hypothetical protein